MAPLLQERHSVRVVWQLVQEREAVLNGQPVVVRNTFPGSKLLRRIGLMDVESYVLFVTALTVSGVAGPLGLRVFGVEAESEDGVVLREDRMTLGGATQRAAALADAGPSRDSS